MDAHFERKNRRRFLPHPIGTAGQGSKGRSALVVSMGETIGAGIEGVGVRPFACGPAAETAGLGGGLGEGSGTPFSQARSNGGRLVGADEGSMPKSAPWPGGCNGGALAAPLPRGAGITRAHLAIYAIAKSGEFEDWCDGSASHSLPDEPRLEFEPLHAPPVHQGQDQNAITAFLIEDHVAGVLVPPDAERDGFRFAPHFWLRGQKLEASGHVLVVALGLRFAECLDAVDIDFQKVGFSPFGKSVATHASRRARGRSLWLWRRFRRDCFWLCRKRARRRRSPEAPRW